MRCVTCSVHGPPSDVRSVQLSQLIRTDFAFLRSYVRVQCVFGSGFLFFTLTTPPKIGFQNLLQNMIAEEEAGQVFGFVGWVHVALCRTVSSCVKLCVACVVMRQTAY